MSIHNCIALKSVDSKGMFSLSPGTLCGPLEISDGPPVVHLDHVQSH